MTINFGKIREWIAQKIINEFPLESALLTLLGILSGSFSLKLDNYNKLLYFKEFIQILAVFLAFLLLFKISKKFIFFIKDRIENYKYNIDLEEDFKSFRSNHLIYFGENLLLDILFEKKLKKFESSILNYTFFSEQLTNIINYCEEEHPNEEQLHGEALNFKRMLIASSTHIYTAINVLTSRKFVKNIGGLYKIEDFIWKLNKNIETKKEKDKIKWQKEQEKRLKEFTRRQKTRKINHASTNN